MWPRLLAAVAAVAAPLAIPSTAHADPPVDRGIVRESFTESLQCDGFTLTLDVTVKDRFSVQPAPGDPYGQAFLAHSVFRVATTGTNNVTGQTFTALYHSNIRELRAQHLYGDIYEFQLLEVASLLVKDSRGRPFIRENAVQRHVQVFDTLGDREPGGEELSLETTVVSGTPFTSPDPCEIAEALTT